MFANVTFLNCEMGSFISPEGWHAWSDKDDLSQVKFAEYGNYGPGADLSRRVEWSVRLSRREASKYSKENIFAPCKWDIPSGRNWYEPDYK
jgi:pectinesterase